MAPVAVGGNLAGFRTISCSNGSTILPLLPTTLPSPPQTRVCPLPFSILPVLSSVVLSLLSSPVNINW